MKIPIWMLVFALALTVSSISFAQESTESVEEGKASSDVDTKLPMGPILLGSFSGVMLAIGAGIGWQAYLEHQDWKDLKNSDVTTEADMEFVQRQMRSLEDDVRNHSIVANVFIFTALAGIGASLIWWAVDRKKDREGKSETNTAMLLPVIAPGQAGLVLKF